MQEVYRKSFYWITLSVCSTFSFERSSIESCITVILYIILIWIRHEGSFLQSVCYPLRSLKAKILHISVLLLTMWLICRSIIYKSKNNWKNINFSFVYWRNYFLENHAAATKKSNNPSKNLSLQKICPSPWPYSVVIRLLSVSNSSVTLLLRSYPPVILATFLPSVLGFHLRLRGKGREGKVDLDLQERASSRWVEKIENG